MTGGRYCVLLVGLTVLASGCAGPRTRQDLARLNSQVGLLEERVGQLERTGTTGYTSAAFPEAAPEASAPAGDMGMTTTAPAKRHASSSSAKSSVKPSTREVQQALKNAGFYQGAVDGKMGPMTRDAIKEFQRINGLHDDGVVGHRTWGKLKAYADMSGAAGEATAGEFLK